ncbi:MAG: DUF45 domain-containing protein [Candidatus Kaiserbacteria bacterium]|nr:DUF45 domain-containing protein [Candidatus Kaiserbacteria bacterium]
MPYDIRVSDRARLMRLTVDLEGTVRVTVPRRFSQRAVDRFVARHRNWIEKHRRRSRMRTVITAEKAHIPQYKKAALALAEELCERYASSYGVTFKKITIRAQKSRWGSCSREGNLSFNYKIALLPREITEYIVIHEICHLIRFDHSRGFWREVEKAALDHMIRRRRLRNLAFSFR